MSTATDENDPILPFGKYKGQRCSDVPVSYLDWLIGQDWMDEKKDLKEAIIDHLHTRPEWRELGED